MKGFLNKVQSKVGGGKNPDGKPVSAASEAMPSAGGSPNSPKIETTPRADISLPRRHDRRYNSQAPLSIMCPKTTHSVISLSDDLHLLDITRCK